MGRDGGDLARVVRLHAADRDERVAALGERVGDEVLELARLVAAEGEARGAVVALGPDGGAAQVLRQPVEPVDGRGTERQRIALEVVERPGSGGSCGCGTTGHGRAPCDSGLCMMPALGGLLSRASCAQASASPRVSWIVRNVVRPAIFNTRRIAVASCWDHELEPAVSLPHALTRHDEQGHDGRVEECALAQIDEQEWCSLARASSSASSAPSRGRARRAASQSRSPATTISTSTVGRPSCTCCSI